MKGGDGEQGMDGASSHTGTLSPFLLSHNDTIITEQTPEDDSRCPLSRHSGGKK